MNQFIDQAQAQLNSMDNKQSGNNEQGQKDNNSGEKNQAIKSWI
jgi:hypothetical protein